MYSSVRSKQLEQLGIIQWQLRNTLCLVIMPCTQQATKVLQGMLGVLQLPESKIVQLVVDNFDQDQLAKAIAQHAPQFILQLSMEHALIVADNISQTFSPDHLASNAQDKASAYKVLLELRDKINYGTI